MNLNNLLELFLCSYSTGQEPHLLAHQHSYSVYYFDYGGFARHFSASFGLFQAS